MSMEHFEKIIPLASLTTKGCSTFRARSSLLYIEVYEMLKKIPPRLQKQLPYTNLTTNISDHTFKTLSVMRIHAINISVESFFLSLRTIQKNAKLTGSSAIDRMVHFFKKTRNRRRSDSLPWSPSSMRGKSRHYRKCHTLYHALKAKYAILDNPGPGIPGNMAGLTNTH